MPAQNPYIQHYTTVDGLPSNKVNRIYQDSRKFIWFATDAGLAKYDGSKFTHYLKQDGLSCNEIEGIKEDSFGRIWFFNLNSTLNFYYRNKIYNGTNAPFLDSLISEQFFIDFFEDNDKTLYFYYNFNRDVFALDSQNIVNKYKLPSVFIRYDIDPEFKPYEGMVTCFINKAAAGEFYLWTLAGIFRLNNFTEEPKLVTDKFVIAAVYPVSEKNCYVNVGFRGASRYEIRKSDFEAHLDTILNPIRLESNFISSIIEDDNGFLWIANYEEGVFVYKDNKLIRQYDISEPEDIIKDHENNIWISTHKDGVYKVSEYINQHIQYEGINSQDRAILDLCRHISNGIWCTNGKTVFLLQNNDLFTSDFYNGQSAFDQLLQVNDSILLVGQLFKNQYALKKIRTDTSAKKIYFNEVSVSFSPNKKFSLNSTGDEIITFYHENIYFINPVEFFSNIKTVNIGEQIFNTFYNSNNDLCVNTRKNYIFKNDSLMLNEKLSWFDDKIITDHLIINNSTELFNLEGDSLYLLNCKRLYNLTTAFGYPIDLQIKYMDYHEPTLFIATTRNIYTCENPLNILDNKTVQLQPVDISFRNINDILFNDDLLYIASDDGLTAIPYAAIYKIKTNSPLPYFQSIQINDDQDVVDRQDIKLHGHNRINFNFSSINYSFSPVIFSFKLEGADDKWTIGTGTNVVYQNLPRGDFLFKLKARKPTSDWSEPIEFGITINATLWQHPLFFVTLSVIVAGLFFLLIIRRKNLQLKRQEIEHQLVLLEQKALQSMMNPHFIFNTLGSIQNYLLQSKPSEAGLYLSQFARLIRQNLNSINSAVINLEEEVDRLKNYLDLEKLRMEDKFDYHIDIDKSVESEDILIPSMVIQPFVENSIWHGIASLDEKGIISIRFSQHDEKSLQIIIEDNGIGMKKSEQYSVKGEKNLKLGMEMTRKRLDLLGKKYNVETSIEFSEKIPGSMNPGTRVVLIVPFTFSEE
jgi:two-component sensor histidine kinase